MANINIQDLSPGVKVYTEKEPNLQGTIHLTVPQDDSRLYRHQINVLKKNKKDKQKNKIMRSMMCC